MAELPPLIAYPIDYEYKVIGLGEHGFEAYVRGLVGAALGTQVADHQVVLNPNGKYLAVRITVHLQNEEQRVAVYTALSNQPRIVFYL